MPKEFPFYQQLDAMDCGATCLRMIARHYGRYYSLEQLREMTYMGKQGVTLLGISDAAEHIGLQSLALKTTYDRLIRDIPLPCIAHWNEEHFVVVYKANKNSVWIADPAEGKFKLSKKEFLESWVDEEDDGEKLGVLLLLEPTPEFYEHDGEQVDKAGFGYILSYFRKYQSLIGQLVLGLILGSVLQLIFPFLIKAIVDVGINTLDVSFITLVLVAQLVLFATQVVVEFFRSWILLHVGVRVNISLISDFLIKLTKLPLRFFDSRMTGDLMQRIADHERVQRFFSSTTLISVFSFFNFLAFSAVLLIWKPVVFIVFFLGTLLNIAWILFFMRRRRDLDYKRFDQSAEKGLSSLRIEQLQRSGAVFINEAKNVLITFIVATAVINVEMTLGMLVAIQYIVGQLNSPLNQLVEFVRSFQEARISLERMNEIHIKEDEETHAGKITLLPEYGDLIVENLSFQYEGPHSPMALRDINLYIPRGRTTAIVGSSGSGKTTLLKLLLNFYQPTDGVIRVGDVNLSNIETRMWRSQCGVVMQEGYIFNDTIAHNIALGDEIIDKQKLLKAVKVANIQNFIEALPLGYNTKIGQDGIGVSQGQKQRLLIARAVYKNPEYIFFDEATTSLDAYNEMLIMENLEEFFRHRTVVIVAHRLSTVVNADNIVVLEGGEIVEQGTHDELTYIRGAYYQLIRNQLELGA
ncbi:MAG: peptidase domain-containing ABC transporter [Saprospiraceae bacterium]|nr:peptidase domain-containing ABC transporter [Saprospiraceae bacterium]